MSAELPMELPKRILYVEDNPVDADLARRALARQAPQLDLEVVSTLAEAISRLAPALPLYDAILADMALPDGSGMEILAHVHERRLPIAVVILTGSGDQASAIAALKAGADDYVVKRDDYCNRLSHTLAAAQARFRREFANKAQPLRVLYAEHNVFDVDLTRRHFARHAPQIRVHIVDSGTEALAMLPKIASETSAFDVLLLDYHLPDINALDVTKIVRDERGLDLPVVLVSGRGSEEVVAEALRLGIADYLVKHEGYLAELPAILEHAHRQAQLLREQAALRILSERQRLQAAALESTRDAVMITDLDARIQAVNPAFTEITGYIEAEVLGRNPSVLQSGRHDRQFYQAMWADLREHGRWQGEIWNRRKNAEVSPHWETISSVRDAQGKSTHYVAVITDLTAIKRSAEQLEHLAHYDPLTGLPNRVLLRSLLQHAVEKAQRQDHQAGVLFINLDKFKNINDSLGHASGDQVLLGIADRLKQRLGGEHLLGRMGADEFVVVIETLRDPADVEATAVDLLLALDTPFSLDSEHEVYAPASIGISIFPQDGMTAHDLLQRADTAVHRAKERGGNQIAFYTSEWSARALRQLEIEGGLRRALIRGEFVLYFQPKVDLASGCITSAEALLRWQRPDHGLVSPAEFIPLAEKNGQIVAIGAWILDEVCRQLRAWQDAGLPGINVAANVSARQFRSVDLETVVTDALARHGIEAQQLTLELTESMLMDEPEQAIERLHRLKGIGLKLSLDDFGTGYSSLAYLRRFPMDQLKIDRSFVIDIVTDPSAANIANTIIDLAHRMQLSVVAEGVEAVAQLEYLRANHCDEIQGFYFSAPVPAEEFAGLVRRGPMLSALGTGERFIAESQTRPH